MAEWSVNQDDSNGSPTASAMTTILARWNVFPCEEGKTNYARKGRFGRLSLGVLANDDTSVVSAEAEAIAHR